jgi:hypothetical protein
MNKHELLRAAIHTIAQRAGMDRPVFHLTSVSLDSAGMFIMQTQWPQGRLICEKIAQAVTGFPKDPYTTCIALLPDLVDEIIWVARQDGYDSGDAETAEPNRL